jgi:tetratricopeptide (TPR) repeat protein
MKKNSVQSETCLTEARGALKRNRMLSRGINTSCFVLAAAVAITALSAGIAEPADKINILLKKTARLVSEKKYFSAFKTLDGYDPANGNLEIFILKSRIAIDFHANTFMHQSFAFADLKTGETLAGAREALASTDMFDFQINRFIDKFIPAYPRDLRLRLIKGDYYFDVNRMYGDKWFLKSSETVELSLDGYREAACLGASGAKLWNNTGELYIRKGDHLTAEKFFFKALEADGKYAGACHNLAMLYFKQKKLDQALVYAKLAYELYGESDLKAEAAMLAASVLDEKKDYAGALSCAAEAERLTPGNPLVLRGLLIICLKNKKNSEAAAAAEKLFAVNPADVNLIRDIAAVFGSAGAHKLALEFFDASEKRYISNPKVTGNIFFARAVYHSRFTFNRKEMIKAKSSAAQNYKKVYPPDHEIFTVMDNELNE